MKRIRLAVVLSTVLMSLGAATAAAQACTETWTGPGGSTGSPTSGDWNNPANWSPAGVPQSSDDVCITGSGSYTVSLYPENYQGSHYGEVGGGSVQSLTLGGPSGTQTLQVLGQSYGYQGDWQNSVGLGIGNGGLTIGSNGILDLDSTGDNATNQTGAPAGGSAQLLITTGGNVPVQNSGTIEAQSSDSQWGELMNFGGTLANTGQIEAQSGTLTFSGASPALVVNNTGTLSVSSGASVILSAGNGSSFTNTGTVTNNGSMLATGPMDYVQSGGSESGNPIQIQGGATLEDSAGAGSFLFDLGTGYLMGTIPAGQSVEVQGTTFNCSGNVCQSTTLGLGGNGSSPSTVTNDGTLRADADGSGTMSGGDAILSGAELDNNGTFESTVEDSNWANQLLVPLVNEAGATTQVTGGKLVQTAGTTTTNKGTVSVGAGAAWLVQGGSFVNSGTFAPQIASASSFGTITMTTGGTFAAGGTLAPSLASGYTPAAGSEFPVFSLQGGPFAGSFASVSGGFSVDTTHETASPAFVGLVYGATLTAPPSPNPKVTSATGDRGALSLKLSCAAGGAACAAYSVTGTLTEHLKDGKVTAVTARSSSHSAKPKPKAKTKVVTVARSHGTLAAGKTVALTVKLNGAGQTLLRRFGHLKVQVTVTVAGKPIRTVTVTVTRPKPPKKTKNK